MFFFGTWFLHRACPQGTQYRPSAPKCWWFLLRRGRRGRGGPLVLCGGQQKSWCWGLREAFGGCHQWGYPHSWMVSIVENPSRMELGVPHFRTPPYRYSGRIMTGGTPLGWTLISRLRNGTTFYRTPNWIMGESAANSVFDTMRQIHVVPLSRQMTCSFVYHRLGKSISSSAWLTLWSGKEHRCYTQRFWVAMGTLVSGHVKVVTFTAAHILDGHWAWNIMKLPSQLEKLYMGAFINWRYPKMDGL